MFRKPDAKRQLFAWPKPNKVSQAFLRQERRDSGFTLIESALATVIVGTGVLAIVAAQQAYHYKNDWAQRTATAMLLANELRELTLTLPMHDPISGTQDLGPEANEVDISDYDDLDDFAGVVSQGKGAGITFKPPINALRQEVADLSGWSQQIEVFNVLADNISVGDALTLPLGTTNMMRVNVTVYYESPQNTSRMTLAQLTWVVGQ